MEVLATYDSLLETSSPLQHFKNYTNFTNFAHLDLYSKYLEEFKRNLTRHAEAQTVVLLMLYAPVFLLAFFGNVMVLVVVLPNRHMRNVTNFFLVNLAVADLTGKFCIVCLLHKPPSWRFSIVNSSCVWFLRHVTMELPTKSSFHFFVRITLFCMSPGRLHDGPR